MDNNINNNNMKTVYKGDPRYEALYEKMQLLGIQDVSTPRQVKNGTIVWRLPIKNNWPKQNANNIEVASFSTGYVRNQNSGYSNYQLLKYCIKNYFIKHANQVANGDYYPKWMYDEKIHQAHNKHNKAYNDGYAAGKNETSDPEVKVIVNGQRYNIT